MLSKPENRVLHKNFQQLNLRIPTSTPVETGPNLLDGRSDDAGRQETVDRVQRNRWVVYPQTSGAGPGQMPPMSGQRYKEAMDGPPEEGALWGMPGDRGQVEDARRKGQY